jgi:membrane-bound metal-dependent hydrolase YbcI (DUF457 family)
MDIVTHALASLALSRAILPRAPRLLWAWTIPAGLVADTDALSAMLGPTTYLAWHRTYTHSLLASFIFAAIFAVLYRMGASSDFLRRLSVGAVFVAVLLAQWLHLAMDALQWQGVEMFWPLNHAQIAADWLPTIDPWIVAILIAAIVLPELFHLVSSEIGAKDKKPRGFAAAIAGLAIVFLYIGLRAGLHANAIAQLQNRTYAGESPKQVAAFPESASLFAWRCVVETETALHELTVRVESRRSLTLDTGLNLFKPEPGPLLQAAQATESARRFLLFARLPKATVQKMDSGSEVQIHDLRYAAAGELNRELAAVIDFDPSGKVISQEIVWANRETPR